MRLQFCFAALLVLAVPLAAQPLAASDDLAAEVGELVMDLGADAQATREAAGDRLLELGGETAASGERLLELLPKPVEQMPAAVRTALMTIRRTLADRVAKLAVTETRVTLDVVQAPLEEVLATIEQQTGNKIKDVRAQFGQQEGDKRVTIEIVDAPFWEAVDMLLDEAGLGIYSYSGEDALALVGREQGATPRWSTAAYAGPLRIEATRINATRNLRQITGESLTLQLEIAWEPRLRPIAFSQPLAEVQAENENGAELLIERPDQSLDVEISTGSQATELSIPMVLPTRKTSLIASLTGRLEAIIPGREAEFRFTKLDDLSKPQRQQEGGATVTLQQMRKNNDIWELHMRLELAGAEGDEAPADAFASHRGWVFNNITYLEDKEGRRVEHAGFETTMQRGNEIGVAYLFDLSTATAGEGAEAAGDIADYVWIYKTPTAILRFPIEYELNHIPLP